MGGSVRVSADDGHARLGEAELGADDMDDALVGRLDIVELDAEVGAVLAQGVDLLGGDGVFDDEAVGCGRHVVVDGGHGAVGAAKRPAGNAKAFECLRRRDFVDEVQVDIEERRLIGRLGYQMRFPDFFE